jgi:SAM-dependent methyltransferase
MYDSDGADYFKIGLRAIQSINAALAQANLTDVRTILDLPSGGGRVLRFLSARFPAAKITACDIQRDAVDFCGEHLGAEPVYSSANLNEISLEAKFDLIWCGSLMTHLNRGPMIDLLKFFKRHLSAGSLLVFTTHGDFVAARLPQKEFDYGFGFAPWPKGIYDSTSEFGVSLTSPDWIDGQVRMVGGMRKVYFASRGWDDHQDVFGFVRE